VRRRRIATDDTLDHDFVQAVLFSSVHTYDMRHLLVCYVLYTPFTTFDSLFCTRLLYTISL